MSRRVAGFGRFGLVLLVAVSVAACGGGGGNGGGGNGSPKTGATNGGGNGGNGSGSSLTEGLSDNLSKLDSYQFVTSTAAKDSQSSGGEYSISGTVINKPAKAIHIKQMGLEYIVIGTDSWMSSDGEQWIASGDGEASVDAFLPTELYSTWWDGMADGYKAAGEETKNGVKCVHYTGTDELSGLYKALGGLSYNFKADLWIAKDGLYPVSGLVSWAASAGGNSGAVQYKFDITNINDASNKIEKPTNIMGG